MTDVLERIAADRERTRRRVREIIGEHGAEALAEFDAGMEHVESGRYAMAMLWHSLSEPQRRVVRLLGDGDRVLARCRHTRHFYDAHGGEHAVDKAAGRGTVAKLVAHGVLRWSGKPSDPEQLAELASRGRGLLAALVSRN